MFGDRAGQAHSFQRKIRSGIAMMRNDRLLTAALLACLGIAACSDSSQPNTSVPEDASRPAMAKKSPATTDEYLLVAPDGAELPATLAASVTAAGGTLVRKYDGAGVAVPGAEARGAPTRSATTAR